MVRIGTREIEVSNNSLIKMVNIAIIGAGQIGSRHLQAMAQLEEPAEVQLVDHSEASLRTAQERFYDVYDSESKKIELKCRKSIDALFDHIDVAIVATCSDVRSAVIREVTRKKEVKSFILEKVLFQTIGEYFEIAEVLTKKNIPAWVNCWMREKDFYKKLKTQLNLDEKIQMTVEGSLWGMGGNSIHFIDLFSYLTDCKDFSFVDCRLGREIVDSKRNGYKEFFGRMLGKNSKGDLLSLECSNQGNRQYRIRVINGTQIHEITDCVDHVVYKFFDGEKESIDIVDIPFQSQTTHRIVSQIFNMRYCDLTPYHDSIKLHLPLIEVLIEHLQKVTGSAFAACPIT